MLNMSGMKMRGMNLSFMQLLNVHFSYCDLEVHAMKLVHPNDLTQTHRELTFRMQFSIGRASMQLT